MTAACATLLASHERTLAPSLSEIKPKAHLFRNERPFEWCDVRWHSGTNVFQCAELSSVIGGCLKLAPARSNHHAAEAVARGKTLRFGHEQRQEEVMRVSCTRRHRRRGELASRVDADLRLTGIDFLGHTGLDCFAAWSGPTDFGGAPALNCFSGNPVTMSIRDVSTFGDVAGLDFEQFPISSAPNGFCIRVCTLAVWLCLAVAANVRTILAVTAHMYSPRWKLLVRHSSSCKGTC